MRCLFFVMWVHLFVCSALEFFGPILNEACSGNLNAALARTLSSLKNEVHSAGLLHIRSALEFILYGEAELAVRLHREAKQYNATLVPPLAQLFLQKHSCGGLNDIFYVSAVIIKQLVDSTGDFAEPLLAGHTTMVTLLADSGLNEYADVHLQRCRTLAPYDASFVFRSILATPAVYSSHDHLMETRVLLEKRLSSAMDNKAGLSLTELNEFSLSTTFYLVYQGMNDTSFLSNLSILYQYIYAPLSTIDPAVPHTIKPSSKIRVGFVSSYFRRHSICKLYCGLLTRLDRKTFDVYVFSSTARSDEDAVTKEIEAATHFLRIGKPLVQNRHLVVSNRIDILVYLDIGMDPAMKIWASARLAPIQVCLWGHPSTTGLAAMDYFISSDSFHAQSERPSALAQEAFSEQLVKMDTLGFYFKRPTLPELSSGDYITRGDAYYAALIATLAAKRSSVLGELIERRQRSEIQLVLCPQHLPKFHPSFDTVLRGILQSGPDVRLVLVYSDKKSQWRRVLEQRWTSTLGATIVEQIVWLQSLSPEEYLVMLAAGDIMIDPYPFGGGVTSLEALAVLTPVLTLPLMQTVPALTAGMYVQLGDIAVHSLTAFNVQEYISKAVSLLANAEECAGVRKLLHAEIPRLYDDADSVQEWEHFFQRIAR